MSDRAAAWLSQGLAALVDACPGLDPDVGAEARAQVPFDVIIVGSGYGAAVAAEKLSGLCDADGRRLSVCVLERGQEYLGGSFPSRLSDLAGHVRFATPQAEDARGMRDGLFDLRTGPDASVLVASGVGGGSLINAGVLEPPQRAVMQGARWPKKLRNDKGFIPRALALRQRLGGGKAWAQAYPKTEVLQTLSPTSWRPVHVSVAQKAGPNAAQVALDGCIGCGDCFTGCNHSAKDSLDLNLLVLAQRAGAQIISGATVLRLQQDAQHTAATPLWRVFVNHTAAELRRRQKSPFELLAHHVILAAGTLGSTEILMRSKTAGLRFSNLLGQRFSANGDLIAAVHGVTDDVNAVADEATDPRQRKIGPTITSMIDLRGKSQVVVQDLAVPAALRRLYEEAFTLADVLNRLTRSDDDTHGPRKPARDPVAVNPLVMRHSLPVALIGLDAADGELRLPAQARADGNADARDGVLSVHWPELKAEARLAACQELLDQLRADARVGGRVLANPAWRPLDQKLESIFGQARGPLLTVHPLGGCTMGEDVRSGVVDCCGRVFRVAPETGDTGAEDSKGAGKPAFHPGLYVLDGSIVPSALGINPALTIATLAERAIDGWLAAGGEDWLCGYQNAPASAAPATVRPRFAAAPGAQPVAPTLVEVTERMRGQVALRTGLLSSQLHHVELTLRFEPQGLAQLCGAEAGTRKLKVRTGELRLATEPPDPVTDAFKPVTLALSAKVSGDMSMFDLESSGPLKRRLWAGAAWLLNRGLRDIGQSIRRRLGLHGSPCTEGAGAPGLGGWEYVKSLWRLASHAGAVRLLDYRLELDGAEAGPAKTLRAEDFERASLQGIKRFTYNCAGNPWMQLARLTLKRFPKLSWMDSAPTLVFDARHAARIGVPLLRVVQQQDRPAALADLASLLLYITRMAITVHGLSFRKPDDPNPGNPRRLPGAVRSGQHLLTPDIVWLDTWTNRPAGGAPVRVRLARYRGPAAKATRPVLLLHGYSASGTTFAHDAIPGHLVDKLCAAGRDVWVVDLRTSAGLPTATEDWTFDVVARWDIPAAVAHVKQATGADKVDFVAHCMGAAMLSLALLDAVRAPSTDPVVDLQGHLSESVGRVVFSQIAPLLQMSAANTLRAYVMSYVRFFLPLEDYQFRREPGQPVSNQVLDRLLTTLPYPHEEFRLENPLWPLGAETPWAGTRHRMDALYARTFSLPNMPPEVLASIDDFFGPLSVQTVTQVIHFAQQFSVTNSQGHNYYTAPEGLKKKLTFPILCLHGQDNGLADPATLDRMARGCAEAGIPHWSIKGGNANGPHVQTFEEARSLIQQQQSALDNDDAGLMTWCLPGHGHQDCLIGRSAGQVNDVIALFLRPRQIPQRFGAKALP